MNLNKINGNSYYIDNPTNIGVYIYKDKYCMLIDTGINNQTASKIESILINAGLKPKYIINTHHHSDHAGGNHYFKENYTGCIIYEAAGEKIFIENELLFSEILYGANPVKELSKGNGKAKRVDVDIVLESGTVKINDEKFEIISLPGHSAGGIGIVTPDRVCFLGDSIFSESILKKHPLPFLFDIEKQINTLNYIKSLENEYYILGHADNIYDRSGIAELSDMNIDNINKNADDIKELLSQPLSREDLLEQICILNNIELDFREYYICHSAVGAFISYLYNKDILDYQIQDGKLYYYIRP